MAKLYIWESVIVMVGAVDGMFLLMIFGIIVYAIESF